MSYRYWSKEFIIDFIEMYKSYPCLWNKNTKDYTNKSLKYVAYNKLIEFCQHVNPEANRDFVVKKIQGFRGVFRKELKKVLASKKSAASQNDIYTPTLWYYNLLLFTVDEEMLSESIDTIHKEEMIETEHDEMQQLLSDDPTDFKESIVKSQTNPIQLAGNYSMTDCRYWSKDFIIDFIDLYKSFPCLWKIKSKEYSDKNLKNVAYKKLIELCKEINPEANRDYVVKKIQSLRGSFRKETKRVLESRISGASQGEMYTSSLWYYDLLLFTVDQEIPAASTSTTDEEVVEMEDDDIQHFSDDGTADISESIDDASNFSQVSETPSTSTTAKRSNGPVGTQNTQFMEYKKRKKNDDVIEEYDAVAISWAKKLKRMEPTQAIYAEALIHKILAQGLLKQLTDITEQSQALVFPTTSGFS